ncbi:hypothetical protein PQR34_20045 [Paraburkholderia sediminicola]|jgi:hypothetical protein|uniref:hypothetical protein n=1 Tax=Paraburkholderia sediminicola TaxID=458836 RepID=UPI0038BC7D6A
MKITIVGTGYRGPCDGHNLYEPQQTREWGLAYHAIGRSSGREVAPEASAH